MDVILLLCLAVGLILSIIACFAVIINNKFIHEDDMSVAIEIIWVIGVGLMVAGFLIWVLPQFMR